MSPRETHPHSMDTAGTHSGRSDADGPLHSCTTCGQYTKHVESAEGDEATAVTRGEGAGSAWMSKATHESLPSGVWLATSLWLSICCEY